MHRPDLMVCAVAGGSRKTKRKLSLFHSAHEIVGVAVLILAENLASSPSASGKPSGGLKGGLQKIRGVHLHSSPPGPASVRVRASLLMVERLAALELHARLLGGAVSQQA